jgi:hypothetical protein
MNIALKSDELFSRVTSGRTFCSRQALEQPVNAAISRTINQSLIQ